VKKIVNKQILHIDMNSFYASCEQAANKELKKAPLIVGGDPERRSGIVLAASYDAKKYGVKTTMPLYQAAKLCPTAKFVKASRGLYEKMSKEVMKIFDDYTPLKEQVSIDEAFLDMTGTEKLFGNIYEVSKTIQNRILKELDLPCSVGISSNKLLAKMASDYKKPMGITSIYPNEVEKKIWHLPVSSLHGVGRKTSTKLVSMGILTIGDLAKSDIKLLIKQFGEKTAKIIKNHANGIASDEVNPLRSAEVKSIGNENTYPNDLTLTEDIYKQLLIISDKVGYRLRKKMLKGKTITIKIKFNDFTIINRSKTLQVLTDSTDIIFETAKELYLENKKNKPIRLIGITMSNLNSEDNIQLSLFEESNKTNKVDKMVDEIRNKYGYSVVTRASILDK